MNFENLVLQGTHVRLEPLSENHIDGLAAAAGNDRALYQWSPVPHGQLKAAKYVATALAWRQAGTAVPFAIVRLEDGVVVGSTRFWNLERWSWPEGHQSHGRPDPMLVRLATPGSRAQRSVLPRIPRLSC
jgi:RimJ/RimL family protein N-acetyltransferase